MNRGFITALRCLASALLLYASFGNASAEMVTAKDPATIIELLKERGYRAELIEGTQSDYIRTADSGVPITIFFLNCARGKTQCTTVQFYTGFTDFKNTPLSRINDWNKMRRFARAYIDNEGDPVIEMDLDLDFNGIAKENFFGNFDIFLSSIPRFRDHLRGK